MPRNCDEEIAKIGRGQDVTILELSEMAMSAIGYSRPTKSDGTPRMLDVTRLNGLGWHPRVSLSAVSNTHTVSLDTRL
jgi:nucleoside-diphosphate-sugar epimerase